MAQHTCTGCVPIDAKIIDVYIQLLGLKDSTIEAAERAEYAAEHAIGKSPYIGENGDWWEWNDEQGVFIDTGVQARGSIAVDPAMSSTSTNPVQNKVITAAVNEKQDALVSGTNIKTVNGESLLGSGNIVAGDPSAVKYTEQTLTDSQKTQARSNIGAGTYSKAGSGIPKSDLSSAVQTSLGKADTAIQDISGKQDTISDLATIRSGAAAGATAYQKPASGVPASDMASGVQTSLGKADTAYQKPGAGVPKMDLESGVQASLDLADSAIQARPMGEIDPTITPADYATKEELDELEAEVDDIAIVNKPNDFEAVGSLINSYISSTGAVVSNSTDFSVVVYSVKAGEVVTIVQSNGVGSAYLWCTYNGTDMDDVTAANKIDRGNQVGQSNGTNTINIASDCLLAVTIYRLATYSFSKVLPTGIKTVLSEIQQEVEDLNTKASIEALTKVGDIADYYIYSNGDTAYGDTDFTVAVFSVRTGDAITIKLSGGVGGAYLWALYNGSGVSDVSATNKISRGKTLATSNGTNTINVLADGILAVTIYRLASYEIYRAITVTNSERIGELEKDATSRFVLENNILKVASPYGDVDLLVTLGPTGGNGLFDFINVKTTTKDAPINVGPETLVFTAGTDWCAPFIVAAKSNIDGDNKTGDEYNEYFTGGNHQYNNTGSGSTATAELTSLAFFVDGRKVTSGKGFFRKIRIEWTNEVQAYNTTKADGSGRAVLTEKRTMEIEGNKFSATAEIIAKENITIKTWYGLQYSAVQIYPNTEYPGGVNRGVYTGVSDCGNTKPNGIFAYGASHRLEMLADVSFDLGDRRFDSNKAGAFRTATKGYLWIIHNTDFNTGERGSIRGSWRFLPVS